MNITDIIKFSIQNDIKITFEPSVDSLSMNIEMRKLTATKRGGTREFIETITFPLDEIHKRTARQYDRGMFYLQTVFDRLNKNIDTYN